MFELRKLKGQTVDGYELLELLGEGGVGVVYKAQHHELNRLAAIKFLRPELIEQSEWYSRFINEAKIASLLNHENICKCFSVGVWQEKLPYIAFDFVEGHSLREMLSKTGFLSRQEAISIGKQVCSALTQAHSQGIVHRDLKPENIMLATRFDGETKALVLDFGIAKLLPEGELFKETLTKTGALVGSFHYMSPEQCSGSKVDHRSDLYALGCILYECLSGHRAFEGDNPGAVLKAHLSSNAKPVVLADKKESARANLVLGMAMAKDVSNRYQSADQFKIDLEALATNRELEYAKTYTPPAAAKKRNSLVFVATIATIVITPLVLLAVGERSTNEVLRTFVVAASTNAYKTLETLGDQFMDTNPANAAAYYASAAENSQNDNVSKIRIRKKQVQCLYKLGDQRRARQLIDELYEELHQSSQLSQQTRWELLNEITDLMIGKDQKLTVQQIATVAELASRAPLPIVEKAAALVASSGSPISAIEFLDRQKSMTQRQEDKARLRNLQFQMAPYLAEPDRSALKATLLGEDLISANYTLPMSDETFKQKWEELRSLAFTGPSERMKFHIFMLACITGQKVEDAQKTALVLNQIKEASAKSKDDDLSILADAMHVLYCPPCKSPGPVEHSINELGRIKDKRVSLGLAQLLGAKIFDFQTMPHDTYTEDFNHRILTKLSSAGADMSVEANSALGHRMFELEKREQGIALIKKAMEESKVKRPQLTPTLIQQLQELEASTF